MRGARNTRNYRSAWLLSNRRFLPASSLHIGPCAFFHDLTCCLSRCSKQFRNILWTKSKAPLEMEPDLNQIELKQTPKANGLYPFDGRPHMPKFCSWGLGVGMRYLVLFIFFPGEQPPVFQAQYLIPSIHIRRMHLKQP